jgi:hypothetical protein
MCSEWSQEETSLYAAVSEQLRSRKDASLPYLWNEFKTFVQDYIRDPVVRRFETAHSYHTAQQFPGQTSDSFLACVRLLEGRLEQRPQAEARNEQWKIDLFFPVAWTTFVRNSYGSSQQSSGSLKLLGSCSARSASWNRLSRRASPRTVSLHRRAEVHQTQSESVVTLGAKDPRAATLALLTTTPVVVETTPTQAPRMRIAWAVEGTIVGAASPPAITTRTPGVARARTKTAIGARKS